MNKNAILYLYDGAIPACQGTKDQYPGCYTCGGECRHTTDIDHALNPEPHNFVPDEQGNLWERT